MRELIFDTVQQVVFVLGPAAVLTVGFWLFFPAKPGSRVTRFYKIFLSFSLPLAILLIAGALHVLPSPDSAAFEKMNNVSDVLQDFNRGMFRPMGVLLVITLPLVLLSTYLSIRRKKHEVDESPRTGDNLQEKERETPAKKDSNGQDLYK